MTKATTSGSALDCASSGSAALARAAKSLFCLAVVILLSGSVAQAPRMLLEQLKVGGRLAAVIGELPIMQARLFTRVGDTAWSDVDLFDTVAPRLEGFGEPGRFIF